MHKIQYNGKEILPPKSDIVFKSIFGIEPNDRLVDFLNNILDLNISNKDEISICNPEIDKQKESDKFSRLDLKIKTKDSIIDLEIQVINENNNIQRSLYYLSCLIKDSEPIGSKYDHLTTSIVIFICDFIIRDTDSEYHEIYKFIGSKTGSDLNFPARIHFIELPKFNKKCQIEDRNKWMHFLTINDKMELEKVKEQDSIMNDTIEKLLYISADDKLVMEYEARLNAIRDEERRINSSFSAGVKEGRLEGRLEGKIEIAKKMKSLEQDINFIIELTGLTEEEINNIK